MRSLVPCLLSSFPFTMPLSTPSIPYPASKEDSCGGQVLSQKKLIGLVGRECVSLKSVEVLVLKILSVSICLFLVNGFGGFTPLHPNFGTKFWSLNMGI
ncbi:hypothetical protein ACS0TY_024847 [Phlomoides rotata]